MKKLFFLLALVAMSVLAMSQDNQLVWANGRLLYGTPVESIDSLTYDEMQDIDTLHLLLPRTLIKVVHDTVYIHDTVYVETDCGDEDDTSSAGIGVFSVSADKQVTFSKGNLQYTQSTDTWSFASTQWEVIGTDNVTGGSVTSDPNEGDNKYGDALADKVDLFGWSTSANNFGVSTSNLSSVYSGSFVDWGTNKIGNDAPNTWRTLSKDEWMYIFYNRPNAQSLFALGSVNGVNGTIILPDNWTTPDGVSFVASTTQGLSWDGSFYYNSNGNNFSHNTYTAEQWQTMEQAGAVFLAASGDRWGTGVGDVGCGVYWSSTENNVYYAYLVYFDSDYLRPQFSTFRDGGLAVRLVKNL